MCSTPLLLHCFEMILRLRVIVHLCTIFPQLNFERWVVYGPFKRGAKPPKLQVGPRVKVCLPDKQIKYKGPYTIIRQLRLNSFRLSDDNVWNASKLVLIHAEQNSTLKHNSLPLPNSSFMQQIYSPPPCSSAMLKLVTLPQTTLQAPSQETADVPSPSADCFEGGERCLRYGCVMYGHSRIATALRR